MISVIQGYNKSTKKYQDISVQDEEAYSNQVEIPGITSIIHEDPISQATYGNHCELSATTILAVYNDVTNSKGMIRIGTRVSDFAIEWGTPIEFYNGSCKHLIPVRITDTKFGIVYVQSTDDDGYIIAGTISGTTPILGTAKEFKDASTTIPIGAMLWDTDKICIAYANSTTNGQCIIADTTDINLVTLGVEATFVATTDISAYPTLTQICKLTTTLASIVYRVSATVTEVVCLSLSGTTITPETAGKAAIGGSADIRYPSITLLDSSKIVVAYTDVTNTNRGTVHIATISGTTITAGGTEYDFDTGSLATRIPMVIGLSTTLFAVTFGTSTLNVIVKIGYVALGATTVVWGGDTNVASNTTPTYPNRFASTPIFISYTKLGQLTFSYLTESLNQFVMGMVAYNYTKGFIQPMCYRVLTVGVSEQIQLTSIYLKANANSFSGSNVCSLYIDGTDYINEYYQYPDTANGSTADTIKTKIFLLGDSPITLKANQVLYASIFAQQSASIKKGLCIVFGKKISV